MILKITDNPKELGINVYTLSLFDFGQKAYHPFIATQSWDRVEIDLTDDTPRGYIKQLIRNTVVIPKFDKDNVTPKVMQLLCEVVPDSAPKLRATYMRDKKSFYNLVGELSAQYGWLEFKDE